MKKKKKIGRNFYFKKIKIIKMGAVIGSICLIGILIFYLIKIPTYVLIFKSQKCIGKLKIEDSKSFYLFDDFNGTVFGIFISNTDISLEEAGNYFKKEEKNVGKKPPGVK